jgi:hypothetical protein
MRSLTAWAAVAIVAVGSWIMAAVPAAEEPKAAADAPARGVAEPAEKPEGKVLFVEPKSYPEAGHALENVEYKMISGRPFLVGTGIKLADHAYGGKKIWMALDDVACITEFKDAADYEKFLDAAAEVAAR